jgi:putative GTP pyrophosphokinase
MGKDQYIHQIRQQYEKVLPTTRLTCDAMRTHLQAALDQANIPLAVPVQSRVKDLNSLLRKIGRGEVDGGRLKRIRDLIGLRIIVLFPRHVKPACDIVRQIFEVKEIPNPGELTETDFGYRSKHFEATLSNHMQQLEEFKESFGARSEIQVRTAAEHCWAEVSHRLEYKFDASIAPSIKRPLARVAALLEVVDSEIERLLTSRDEYIKVAPYEPDDTPLNIDNLHAILLEHLPLQSLWLAIYDVSPILEELTRFNIDTRGRLKHLLSYHEKSIPINPRFPVVDADEFDESDVVDESPDTVISALLAKEFKDSYDMYLADKVFAAFADIDTSKYEPQSD